MKGFVNRIFVLAAAFTALPALADEALIRKVIESKLGGAKVEAVQAASVPGLYEVRLRGADGARIIYTDAQATHIIIGDIYESRTDRNLTEERLRKFSAIDMDALPYELAVKVQRGNGRRTLVVFADPYCPACKRFEKVLAGVQDITIQYFMYPVIRPELADHSRAVWCAPDRAKAWLDLALRGKPVATSATCDAPIEKILELGGRLGVRSTPTLFLATGARVRGGVSATELNALLDEAAGQRKMGTDH